MVNFREEPNIVELIRTACQQGQKDFDRWVTGRAWYCLHSWSEPASYEFIPEKAAPGYALLETTAYDAGCLPCQSLETCLVDINVFRNTGNIKRARYMPGQPTMTFLLEDPKSSLFISGDTNPIRYGLNAVIPGLQMLGRLEELYSSHRPVETLPIQFPHSVYAGGSVRLMHKNNMVTGTVDSITYFTVTAHSPGRT